jgi:hypothetical protein
MGLGAGGAMGLGAGGAMGLGAGGAVGLGAAGLGMGAAALGLGLAALRGLALALAFLAAGFLPFFATTRFFLRAAAVFFVFFAFLAFAFFDFFVFDFAFFAMIVLPIVSAQTSSAAGFRPPVAQSINSTVWTTGTAVPAAICVIQPILPAAITSGASFSIFPTLRSRNLLAVSGCKML